MSSFHYNGDTLFFSDYSSNLKRSRHIDFSYKIIKIKEPPSPTPIEILTFDFFYYLSILFKKKDYRNPTTFGRSPRIFGAHALQPQKSEKRSIKVLTSSPKTIKLNLQLKEEVVIIPKRLLEKGLT